MDGVIISISTDIEEQFPFMLVMGVLFSERSLPIGPWWVVSSGQSDGQYPP